MHRKPNTPSILNSLRLQPDQSWVGTSTLGQGTATYNNGSVLNATGGEFYLSAVLADQFDPECSSSDASSVGVSIWKEQSGLGISNPDPFLLAVLIPRAAGARLVRLTPLTHPKLFQFCTAQLAAGRLVFRVGVPAHVLTQLFSHPEFPSVTRSRP